MRSSCPPIRSATMPTLGSCTPWTAVVAGGLWTGAAPVRQRVAGRRGGVGSAARLPAVHVDLTCRTAARELDLAVVAAAPVPLAACASSCCGPPDFPHPEPRCGAAAVGLVDEDLIGADVLPGAVLTTSAQTEPPASAGSQLQVVGGPQAGAVRPLGRDALVVGRDPACGLALDDDRVSREHLGHGGAAGGRGVLIADLGSANGSAVDGVRWTAQLGGGRTAGAFGGGALLTIRRAGAEPALDDPDAGRSGRESSVHVLPRAPQREAATVIERPAEARPSTVHAGAVAGRAAARRRRHRHRLVHALAGVPAVRAADAAHPRRERIGRAAVAPPRPPAGRRGARRRPCPDGPSGRRRARRPRRPHAATPSPIWWSSLRRRNIRVLASGNAAATTPSPFASDRATCPRPFASAPVRGPTSPASCATCR